MSSSAETIARHREAVRARLRASGTARPGPGSVAWKINGERIVIAGWGRAILLQLAHPLIAAAVFDHSSFRRRGLANVKRLAETVRAMLALTFGTDEEAIAAAAGINSIHDHVSGHLGERAGSLDAGAPYSAHDPELLRWVHATLLDSLPKTYELLVGPLSPEQRDRFDAETSALEPLLDIPAGMLPRSSSELDTYMHSMLASGRIIVSDTSRMLARAILFPPNWRLLWPVFRPVQLITIGLLPPQIRDGYGFAWSDDDARALARWVRALRLFRRVMPRFVREWPAAKR